MEDGAIFKKLMISKTNEELVEYVSNYPRYQSEAVIAAIGEISARDINVQSDLASIKDAMLKEISERYQTIDLGIPVKAVVPFVRIMHSLIDALFIFGISFALFGLLGKAYNNSLSLLLAPIYYIFFETVFGWTPSKYLMNTVTVNSKGDIPSLKAVILRTLIRYIPFDSLSFLNMRKTGWHDRWSKTYVIEYEDIKVLKKNLELQEYIKGDQRKFFEIVAMVLVAALFLYGILHGINTFFNIWS